jgi:hypothetical protein
MCLIDNWKVTSEETGTYHNTPHKGRAWSWSTSKVVPSSAHHKHGLGCGGLRIYSILGQIRNVVCCECKSVALLLQSPDNNATNAEGTHSVHHYRKWSKFLHETTQWPSTLHMNTTYYFPWSKLMTIYFVSSQWKQNCKSTCFFIPL